MDISAINVDTLSIAGLTAVDWVILLIILISTLRSLFKGFIKELFALITWILSLLLARLYTPPVSAWLVAEHAWQPAITTPVVAVLIVIVSKIILGSIASLSQKAILRVGKKVGLNVVDRLLGTVFGLARGVIIVLFCIMLGKGIEPISGSQYWTTSQLIPYYLVYEEQVSDLMGEFWAQRDQLKGLKYPEPPAL